MIKNTIDTKQQEQMIQEAQRSPLMSETDWWEQTTNNKQQTKLANECSLLFCQRRIIGVHGDTNSKHDQHNNN